MLDLIVSWLATAIGELLDSALGFILPVFGFDFDTFARVFPFAATAYSIFQSVALSITLLVAAWHLIPFLAAWFGYRADQLRSTPLREVGQAVFAVIMIYYGNYIFEAIIEVTQLPFDALLFAEVDASWNPLEFEIDLVIAAFNDIFYQTSILLYLIILVMIGFSLIKVILEAVERYVVLYVLVYLSPLVAAALASEETSGIYSRFFTMFISQCFLLLLNVWTLKMAISMLANLGTTGVPMLALLIGYAFLRVAQKLDSYMNQLGLNAAITGTGLGAELFATGSMLMNKLGNFGGGRTESDPSGNASGILGFAQQTANVFGRYNPASAVADVSRAGLSAYANGFGSAFSDAVGVAKDTYLNTEPGTQGRISTAVKTGLQNLQSAKRSDVQKAVSGVDNVLTRAGIRDTIETGAKTLNRPASRRESSESVSAAQQSINGATPQSDESSPAASKNDTVGTGHPSDAGNQSDAAVAAAPEAQNAVGENETSVPVDLGDKAAPAAVDAQNTATPKEGSAKSSAAQKTESEAKPGAQNENTIPYETLLPRNAYAAHHAMETFRKEGYVTYEPRSVTAVLEGIGANKAAPALKQFVDVGYGNTEAKNATYTMNSNGITASYVKNGRTESLSLLNKTQYSELSHEAQTGYQSFRNRSGDTYYYKTSSEKVAPTKLKKSKASNTSEPKNGK